MDTLAAAIDSRSFQLVLAMETPEQRLRRVFESACDGLYRFILLRVGLDRDAADELLQQTCHEAVRHRRIPADDNKCEAWLRGIARNLIRRHWRVRKRSQRLVSIEDATFARQLAEDMDARPLPPEILARKEAIQAILIAVTSLTSAEQELVLAFYFDGHSQADIASQTGVSVKSVETKLYRVRARLRASLRHLEKE